MSASGTGAAEAGDQAGATPRLVAVPETGGNGHQPARQPARVVVFLGIADDVRSRVAAALLTHRARGRVLAISASPATVDPGPAVAASLAELGVDLAGCPTRTPSPELLGRADRVVAMGYADPAILDGLPAEDWCIDDPRGKDPDAVRCIRDALDRRVQRLLLRMGVAVPTRPR